MNENAYEKPLLSPTDTRWMADPEIMIGHSGKQLSEQEPR